MTGYPRYKPIGDVLPKLGGSGVSVREFDNWTNPKRLTLATSFQREGYGRERMLSRDNALEIDFIKTFVSAGLKPSAAAAYARAFLNRRPSEPVEWLTLSAGGRKGVSSNIPLSEDKLRALLAGSKSTFAIIVNIGEIIRRVDKLFEGE